jgi:hypothetical protein
MRVWFWAGGILCVLIAAGAFFVPAIMNVEGYKETEAVSASEPI